MSAVPDPAKEAILARIRGALRDVPASESSADVAVARDYRRSGEPQTGVVYHDAFRTSEVSTAG